MKKGVLLNTIEDGKIEGVDIEPCLKVVLEDVAGGVDVGACVGGQLHLGVVGKGPVLHALGEPEELAEALLRLPCGHVLSVKVGDVEDSSSIVFLPPQWLQLPIQTARPRCSTWV